MSIIVEYKNENNENIKKEFTSVDEFVCEAKTSKGLWLLETKKPIYFYYKDFQDNKKEFDCPIRLIDFCEDLEKDKWDNFKKWYNENKNYNGNYREEYLECLRLHVNLSLNDYKTLDKTEIKYELSKVGRLFFRFNSSMRMYTKETGKEAIFERIPIRYLDHSYFVGLSIRDESIFEKYFIKMLNSIKEFCDNDGTCMPKYLYDFKLTKNGKIAFVSKLKLIRSIPGYNNENYYIPAYYQVNGNICTDLEYWEDKFKKSIKNNYEEYYNRFKENELPIFYYIKEHLYEGE